MAEKITGFDDWKDLFYKWQKDIGFEPALVKDYKFDAFYDEGTGPDIEFGDYKGRKKFAKTSRRSYPGHARRASPSDLLPR